MTETADSVFSNFKEYSIAEFFKKNRQMLGYAGKLRSLTTIVHEYVTNGLDACEDANILPEIDVKIEQKGNDHYKVTVKDNGPGIPPKHVGGVFAKMLAGTKFHRFVQSRGQQGIGATGCTLYAQITTGRPTHIKTNYKKGKVFECDLMIDVKHNKPVLTNEREYDEDNFFGTEVSAEFKDVQFNWSEYGPGEYLRRTAVANPHAKISFIAPDKQKFKYERAVNVLPKKPKETLPHPRGLTVDDLIDYSSNSKERTIRGFFVKTFDRMSSAKAKEIEGLTSIDFNRKPDSISWKDAEEIVDAIKKVKFLAPNTKELKPIGEKQVEKAILNVLEPEFHAVVTRSPSVYRGGVPFVIEVGIAFGGKSGKGGGEEKKMEIMRFANRAPLLFDAGACALTKTTQEIDWKRYGLRNKENNPVTIMINITSTYIPYTSAGKTAISDEEDVHKEINLALCDAGRKISTYLIRKRKKNEKAIKRQTLVRYIPEIAGALEKLTNANKQEMEKDLLDIVEKKFDEIKEEEESLNKEIKKEDDEE